MYCILKLRQRLGCGGFCYSIAQVVSARNQIELQLHEIYISAHDPLAAAILFHDAEGALRLDVAVAITFLALSCVGTVATIFAFVDYFLSTIQVPFDGLPDTYLLVEWRH